MGWLHALTDSFRSLSRRPVFTLLNALVLALGTSAVTTIFALVSGILLRPLPYRSPERVVIVTASDSRGRDLGLLSAAELAALRRQAPSFENLSALTPDDAVVGSGPDPLLELRCE